MAVTASNIEYPVEKYVEAVLAFDSSYPTGGELITATTFGLSQFKRINVVQTSGVVFQPIISDSTATALIKLYGSASLTPAGTISAPVFTGTAPTSDLNLATPAFSGTGLTAAGQAITTTDNQTMTLNQCAGMWLLSATGATPPNLILSNTAVTGAPAVLTVQGAASTDAGAYKIVKSVAPAGTVSAPTFTGTSIAASGLQEIDNGADVSSLDAVVIQIWGY